MNIILRSLVAAMAFGVCGIGIAAEPIKVGVVIARSPPGSVVQGTQVRDGLEIAKTIINGAGGVLGRQIELLYEDTQGVPEKGRAAVEKLITKDQVVAIVGEHQSSVCLAEIEVVHRYNIPYINTNCWSDAVRTMGYREVFNPNNYNTRVATAMAEVIKALGTKRVVAFAENTDYGIGQAQAVGKLLKEKAPQVEYKFETLDRTGKDFTPAILPLRGDPPDAVLTMMLPPAAYIVMNQLYEQGVAPSAKTWLYDGAGLADYPDFWSNVHEAGKYMLNFALYHPRMNIPPIGLKVGEAYTKKTGGEPNRLVFQAADSLLLVADAIKKAGNTNADAVIKQLKDIKFVGTRGTVQFSSEPGYKFQQWVDIPYVTYQLTEVSQPISKSTLVQAPGIPLDISKLIKPVR
ncbi:MAG TPA: ABC transporter substrate-binding protein [Acidiferrobacterales bacterium]|nr:ABC transporter substrate-binding protein [Acidiferrobacterales bacterium]